MGHPKREILNLYLNRSSACGTAEIIILSDKNAKPLDSLATEMLTTLTSIKTCLKFSGAFPNFRYPAVDISLRGGHRRQLDPISYNTSLF